ncbi:hypothetical protein HTIA_1254 [Halorhabdus tiamatea SARL4B]|uniref:Uncharacterized protein n=1 Tax=Halorhabdus tiamatea SARL4B TaxID=1033806 RepID=S6D0E3_9EURY|nr:hypothetical protein HTIA_1254 [Halorhabdus tiamatea SARL4B]
MANIFTNLQPAVSALVSNARSPDRLFRAGTVVFDGVDPAETSL